MKRLKCQRLFRPQFRKVKIRFLSEIREVSNTLTPHVGVSDYIGGFQTHLLTN